MEAAQRSAEYVFQGIMYYFRREKVCPRFQFTLKDLVEAVDDEMSDDYAKLGGLSAEEDLHEPLRASLKKRMP